MTEIHPTAVVDAASEIADAVVIGPFAVVGAGVRIGAGTRVGAHAVLEGPLSIGRDNLIQPLACVGAAPQDLKYAGEPTRLEIGDHNIIREFATVNRGTVDGGGVTRVGSHNMLMAYSHVAHDCMLGDYVVMANAATLAGHVIVEDHAIVGGLVAIHQHVRIGESAFLGGGAMVSLDVPPYCMAAGDRASLHGLNVIGLKRRGLSDASIDALRAAYRVLFQSGLRLTEALEQAREQCGGDAAVAHLLDFIAASKRGLCR